MSLFKRNAYFARNSECLVVVGFPPRQVRLLIRITEIVENLGLPTPIAQGAKYREGVI
jgi:hypothetical protein